MKDSLTCGKWIMVAAILPLLVSSSLDPDGMFSRKKLKWRERQEGRPIIDPNNIFNADILLEIRKHENSLTFSRFDDNVLRYTPNLPWVGEMKKLALAAEIKARIDEKAEQSYDRKFQKIRQKYDPQGKWQLSDRIFKKNWTFSEAMQDLKEHWQEMDDSSTERTFPNVTDEEFRKDPRAAMQKYREQAAGPGGILSYKTKMYRSYPQYLRLRSIAQEEEDETDSVEEFLNSGLNCSNEMRVLFGNIQMMIGERISTKKRQEIVDLIEDLRLNQESWKWMNEDHDHDDESMRESLDHREDRFEPQQITDYVEDGMKDDDEMDKLEAAIQDLYTDIHSRNRKRLKDMRQREIWKDIKFYFKTLSTHMQKWDWSSLKPNNVDQVLLDFKIPNDFEELNIEGKQGEDTIDYCFDKWMEDMSTMILNLPKTALPALNLTDDERNTCATYQLLEKQLEDEPPEMRDACLYDDVYNFAFPSNNLTLKFSENFWGQLEEQSSLGEPLMSQRINFLQCCEAGQAELLCKQEAFYRLWRATEYDIIKLSCAMRNDKEVSWFLHLLAAIGWRWIVMHENVQQVQKALEQNRRLFPLSSAALPPFLHLPWYNLTDLQSKKCVTRLTTLTRQLGLALEEEEENRQEQPVMKRAREFIMNVSLRRGVSKIVVEREGKEKFFKLDKKVDLRSTGNEGSDCRNTIDFVNEDELYKDFKYTARRDKEQIYFRQLQNFKCRDQVSLFILTLCTYDNIDLIFFSSETKSYCKRMEPLNHYLRYAGLWHEWVGPLNGEVEFSSSSCSSPLFSSIKWTGSSFYRALARQLWRCGVMWWLRNETSVDEIRTAQDLDPYQRHLLIRRERMYANSSEEERKFNQTVQGGWWSTIEGGGNLHVWMSRLTRKIERRELDPVEQELKQANFSDYLDVGAKLGGGVELEEGAWDELKAGVIVASLVQMHLDVETESKRQGLDTFQELTRVIERIEDGVTIRQVQAAADLFEVKIEMFEVTPSGVKIHSFLPADDDASTSTPIVRLCSIAQHFWCITPFDFAEAEEKKAAIEELRAAPLNFTNPQEEEVYNYDMEGLQECQDEVQELCDLLEHEGIPVKFFGEEHRLNPLHIEWLDTFMGGVDKWEKNNFDPPPDLWDRETVLGCLDATVADMKDEIAAYRKQKMEEEGMEDTAARDK
uniref:Uncharacterized protein n=1 Tax=Guillardia theta TaxID=55529 RepID=A0A7S4P393_GUITH|mmetsp:Transcript_42393/g.133551  ORF Transcript_42393/g.133551 Transcript_42393/m.133551 type:complete len:1170 (+) Transcript_42393:183-3692(+)